MEKRFKNRRYWLVPKNKLRNGYPFDKYNIDYFEDLLEVIELTLDTAVHQVGKYYLSSRPEFSDISMRFLVQLRTISSKNEDPLVVKFGSYLYVHSSDNSVIIENDASKRSLIITKILNEPYLHRVLPIHKKTYQLEKTRNKKKTKRKGNSSKDKGIEICSRCDGGNLKSCPVCDGKGFIDSKIITKSRISLKAGSYNLDDYTAPSLKEGNSSEISDHESIHRSDPKDANKGKSTSFRDNGKFGSTPLHDDFDE